MLSMMRSFPSSSLLLRRSFSSTPSSPLAKITVVGRLATDPEASVTSNGKGLVKYVVGSSTGSQENRKTSWFRVSSFDEGPRKDYVMGLKKGTMVYVDGDAKLEKYQAGDGKIHQTLNITQRKKSAKAPCSTKKIQDRKNPAPSTHTPELTRPNTGSISVLARPREQEETVVDETITQSQ